MELLYDPDIALLGVYTKKTETDRCTPKLIASFTIAEIWKQPKCPFIDEWIKKILYAWNE